MPDSNPSIKAVRMLAWCTALWALSFPTMKVLTLTQQNLVPGESSWFLAAACVVYRFGIAGLLVAGASWRTLGQLTRSEIGQGVGLGLFGGGGILLQMDGLMYTSASTSAFLTQCYALFIPLWLAVRRWQRPAPSVWISCLLVMVGVAILSKVNWQTMRMGRGEWETIAASVLFTGQILWLERPPYARNNANHFSMVMFLVMALVCLPVGCWAVSSVEDWWRAYSHPATWGFLGILVGFSTLGGYLLMNRWQRHVPATQAGLIYCLEPVFASLLAMVLPAWFSRWSGAAYANETLTTHLLLGGGLIIAANVLIQWTASRKEAGARKEIL